MRFTRFLRYNPIDFTPRREAAFARKQARERARYPLFPEHIAESQRTVADEIALRQLRGDNLERTMRALEAKHWRKGRSMYFAQPEAVRARIQEEWRAWRGPTTAGYFIYVVEKHTGESERRSAAIRQREAALRASLVDTQLSLA